MTKEELKSYIQLKKEADEFKQQADSYFDEIKSVRAINIDGMPKGHRVENDKIGNLIAKAEQKRETYLDKYNMALKEQEKIERVIDSLESITERRLMRKRYIQDMKWEDICLEMGYSWAHIHRIHADILKKLNKMR